jgi:predicted double-glycine peptidase
MRKITLVLLACLMLSQTGAMAWAGTRSLKEIRENGVIIQQWDTSCAAAALATVFTYYFDDPVSEREVARGLLRQTEPLKVRHRGGFSMLDMKRYAAERGYRAIGFGGMEFNDIRYFHGPIVPINIKGYNHYVIIKGVTAQGDILLADPAFGNRIMPRDRFETAWMGGIVFAVVEAEH